jgi:hypothetical protein
VSSKFYSSYFTGCLFHQGRVETALTLRRLLLRHAMDRAQPPDQIAAMYADNLMFREDIAKYVQGDAIMRIIERGYED